MVIKVLGDLGSLPFCTLADLGQGGPGMKTLKDAVGCHTMMKSHATVILLMAEPGNTSFGMNKRKVNASSVDRRGNSMEQSCDSGRRRADRLPGAAKLSPHTCVSAPIYVSPCHRQGLPGCLLYREGTGPLPAPASPQRDGFGSQVLRLGAGAVFGPAVSCQPWTSDLFPGWFYN